MKEKTVVEIIEAFICNGWNIIAFLAILAYGILFIHSSKSHRQVSAIPAFCTGIGVFFTFLVLWLKLHSFEIPAESSTSTTTTYLEKLIQELTSAFSTSIIGVIMSLIFTPFVKWKLDTLDNNLIKDKPHLEEDPRFFLHELVEKQKETISENQALKKILEIKLKTQEELATKINKEIKLLNKDTKNSMNKVSQSVDSLASNFEQELTKTFEGLTEKISILINTLSEEAVKRTQATTEDVNNKFREQTYELLERNIGSIELALDTNNKHLASTLIELKTFVETIKGQFTETQTKANEQIEKVQGGIEKTSEKINTHLEEQATQLSVTIATINSTMLELNDKLQGATQKLLDDNLSKLTTAFSNIDNLQKTVHTNLEQSTSKFAQAVNQYQDFTDNNKAIIDAVKKQIKASEKLTEKNEAIARRWDQLSLDVETMQNRIEDINNVILKLDNIKDNTLINRQTQVN